MQRDGKVLCPPAQMLGCPQVQDDRAGVSRSCGGCLSAVTQLLCPVSLPPHCLPAWEACRQPACQGTAPSPAQADVSLTGRPAGCLQLAPPFRAWACWVRGGAASPSHSGETGAQAATSPCSSSSCCPASQQKGRRRQKTGQEWLPCPGRWWSSQQGFPTTPPLLCENWGSWPWAAFPSKAGGAGKGRGRLG